MFGYEPKGQGFESLAARQRTSSDIFPGLFFFLHFCCKGFESPLRKQSGGLFLGRRVDDTRFFRIRTFRGWNCFSALPPCSAPKKELGFIRVLSFFTFNVCKGFESPFRKQSGGLFLGRRVDGTRFFRIRTFRGGNYFSALPPCSAPKNKFGYFSGLVLFLHFCCKGFESPLRKQSGGLFLGRRVDDTRFFRIRTFRGWNCFSALPPCSAPKKELGFIRVLSFFTFNVCKGFESPFRKQSGGLFLGRRVDGTRFFRIRTFRGGNYFSALPPCSVPKNKFGYFSGLVLFLFFSARDSKARLENSPKTILWVVPFAAF